MDSTREYRGGLISAPPLRAAAAPPPGVRLLWAPRKGITHGIHARIPRNSATDEDEARDEIARPSPGVERASSTKRTPSNRSRCSPSASRRSSHRASPSAARAPWRAPASCRGRRAPRPRPLPPLDPPLPRNYKVNRSPRRAPASWANLPSQAVGVVDQLVDRSLRNQRAPVRYRTEGGGESARGTGIEAPLLQFSFCPLLPPASLLPLERPRCAEKEGAP